MVKACLLALAVFAVSCGSDVDVKQPDPAPAPKPGTDPGQPAKTSYAQMQQYLVNYCSQCHATAQFMQSEAGLRASSVKPRLTNRSMPPANASKTLPDNIRTEMINFF